jgi:hypothetical protein
MVREDVNRHCGWASKQGGDANDDHMQSEDGGGGDGKQCDLDGKRALAPIMKRETDIHVQIHSPDQIPDNRNFR